MIYYLFFLTGQMRFGNFDVTEAQITMMSLMLLTALVGSDFWSWNLLGKVVENLFI